MTTNNHPAHGPVSLERLHQIREILSKAAAQSDGGNLSYAMADAVKVIDEVLNAEPVAYMTYKGYLLHAADPKLAEYSEPMPLYAAPQLPQPAVLSVSEGVLKSLLPDVEKSEFWFDHNGKIFFEGVRFNNAVFEACRAAMLQAGNSPVIPDGLAAAAPSGIQMIPDGYVMVPKEPTAKMYDAGDQQMATKQVWDAMIAAAPQPQNSPQNIPEIIPGWIPVSERMPEVGVKVLCFPVEDEPIHASFNGQLWLQDISWSVSDESIDNVISCNVTHWMPLPASPQQEVKSALEHGMQRYAGAMQKLSEGDK
ncbi:MULTISPECIES: DUF551 domain-containing protein [Citrobacter]|uniref:DUF551 domain-containing protein n=1 Tax=Citrobacter TaxID=544 RepID=UPI0016615F52|nr:MULTISPECIES: DUF551 domain-containing protein [Citrobacter]MBD0827663.1 DUF551 domain-containing protein [Citrobacter sp. C1]